MARFILANLRAGKFAQAAKIASQAAVGRALGGSFVENADVLADNQPVDATARRVVVLDMDPAEVAAKQQQLPSEVVIEPEILHYPRVYRPMDFQGIDDAILFAPALFGRPAALKVKVRGKNKPLVGAHLILFLRATGDLKRQMEGITDDQGLFQFNFSGSFKPSALVVVPAGQFWPVVVRGPANPITVDCQPLPDAKAGLGWWHTLLGNTQYSATAGAGIRVGVIDTGAGPHPNLTHGTNIGAFIDGGFFPDGGADVDSHGTHVSGTIGARITKNSDYAGLAPGVELFTARVFPPNRGANQGDIVNALDALSREHKVDLINMSLGAPIPSQIEHDAIIDALERGTLCICAAANSNGPVEYPAAFPEAVAVAAIGRLGWGPPGSLAATRVPLEKERFGDDNLYHANFSCFGPEITCAGPGVGIIAPVPERLGLMAPHGAMDGTSMASPSVCGVLAAILAVHESYTALEKNQVRSAEALRLLKHHCRTLGLQAKFEGFGMPRID
jgi:subtilisin family serine protease